MNLSFIMKPPFYLYQKTSYYLLQNVISPRIIYRLIKITSRRKKLKASSIQEERVFKLKM